jgi:Fanconi anemia group M protein
LKISIDYREKRSGLTLLLNKQAVMTEVKKLPFCDYLINDQVSIERKTARDFIVSIIDGRLFHQASNLVRNCSRPLLLLEGNPFKTDLRMEVNAIRGALISVQSIWNIPIVYSRSVEDTCQILLMIGQQSRIQSHVLTLRHGYRPKRLKSKKLFVLQGLPGVGPVLAQRLLAHFKSVACVFKASDEQLLEVEGVGKGILNRIRSVIE